MARAPRGPWSSRWEVAAGPPKGSGVALRHLGLALRPCLPSSGRRGDDLGTRHLRGRERGSLCELVRSFRKSRRARGGRLAGLAGCCGGRGGRPRLRLRRLLLDCSRAARTAWRGVNGATVAEGPMTSTGVGGQEKQVLDMGHPGRDAG